MALVMPPDANGAMARNVSVGCLQLAEYLVFEDAKRQIERLRSGDILHVTIELTNPETQYAVQVQMTDYHMIGWAPRYLVKDLVTAIAHAPGDYGARVVRVNPVPAPSRQRVLIELSGHWPHDYEPMSADEFQLLREG